MTTCPRCGDELGEGQEYCLECGVRLPGRASVGPVEDPGRGWVRRALAGLVIAAAGAAAAVATTGWTVGDGDDTGVVTALGGFATTAETEPPAASGTGSRGLVEWPARRNGWTIVLASLPQIEGRRPALARARQARRSGLRTVGILDSSRYASLHPGYWVVFSGMYTSEAEATSALQPALGFSRTASVRRIVH